MKLRYYAMGALLTMMLPTMAQKSQCCKSNLYSGNPILAGFHADPEVLYSEKTGKYYIYSTTDGTPGWGGWYFT